MAGFKTNEWISQSPAAVFAFMTDPANANRIMPNVVKMEKISNEPLGIGTKFRETRRVQGKEHETELLVSAYAPPQRYSVVAEQSGIQVLYHYTLTPEREGARINLECEVTAKGLKKIMLPMVAAMMRREDGNHLQGLKRAVEQAEKSMV